MTLKVGEYFCLKNVSWMGKIVIISDIVEKSERKYFKEDRRAKKQGGST